MNRTLRLHDDPFLRTFEARVLGIGQRDGKPTLMLDRTAFYAEGGGQPADHGVLLLGRRRIAIADVQVDEAGIVEHVIELPSAPAEADDLRGALAEVVGSTIEGTVDERRRRDFMSQHTGQHLLSAALVEVARADTVSSRLGEDASTIDVDANAVSPERLRAAEDWVNDVVLSDREISVLWPTPEQLDAMKLRRAPKVTGAIRVVAIEGADISPCGGTHCTRTGQIGPVRITSTERYKGGTRLYFLAGKRTLERARRTSEVLDGVAKELTCGAFDVPSAIARLRSDLQARIDALASARGELIRRRASELLLAHPPSSEGPVRIAIDRTGSGDELAELRALAGALAARADVVAIVGARGETGWTIVTERGAGAAFDAGAWVKRVTGAHGGRGGGRADRAEGRVPSDVTWETIAAG